MKVLLINGSPHPQGNTATALSALADQLNVNGIETETIWIGAKAVQGCVGCYKCSELGRCVFTDDLYNRVRESLEAGIDGLVIASPTYYAGPNGSLCALLDRVFYSSGPLLKGRVGASVAVCRRGGGSTTFERLNKYFEIMSMPMPNSQYWNILYGRRPGEVVADAEGMQTLRTLANNMSWLMKALADNPMPDAEPWQMTNFIRRDLTEHS